MPFTREQLEAGGWMAKQRELEADYYRATMRELANAQRMRAASDAAAIVGASMMMNAAYGIATVRPERYANYFGVLAPAVHTPPDHRMARAVFFKRKAPANRGPG